MFMPSGCKAIGIRNLGFVTNAQHLYLDVDMGLIGQGYWFAKTGRYVHIPVFML